MFLKDYYPKLNKKFFKVKFKGISFDSSNVKKDYIFFAIKGNNLDGNKFVSQAFYNGASISINENKKKNKFKNDIYVKNSLKTFSEIGKIVRASSNISTVAITGSSGKTSLKEMLGQLMNKICQGMLVLIRVHLEEGLYCYEIL